MPNIIEQLEAGKKIQEEEGIDANSLRTKICSTEENENIKEKPKSKRGRKKKEIPEQESNKEIDMVEQEKQIINNPIEQKKEEDIKEEKPEKFPGFDFNNYYEVGQKIFYIRIHEKVGIREIVELKIRTIYPKTIIGFIEKGYALCIGPETKDMIFTDRKEAVKVFNKIDVKIFKDKSPKDELGDLELEDTED